MGLDFQVGACAHSAAAQSQKQQDLGIRIITALIESYRSPRQLRRADRLSEVALRVFRDVHQQPYYSGGQALSSHPARLGQRGWIDRTNDLFGTPQRPVDVRQQLLETGAGLHLRRRRGHLRRVERPPFQICRQAVHAARDMPEMKAQRREAMRARPKLAGRKPRGVPRQIFAGLLEPVQRRRNQRMDLRQRPAQPGFRKIAAVPAQFFFSAFFRCRVSGTPSPWVNVPVITEASLFNVPS